jgi:hypothetical protein
MAEIGYATSRWHEKIVEIPKKKSSKKVQYIVMSQMLSWGK